MICRIVNSVEAISVELVKEDNFADYKHFADELGFKAEMVRIGQLLQFFSDAPVSILCHYHGNIGFAAGWSREAKKGCQQELLFW